MRTVTSSTTLLTLSMLCSFAYGQSPFTANPFSKGNLKTGPRESASGTSTPENSTPSPAVKTSETLNNKRVDNPFFSENAAMDNGTDRMMASEPSQHSNNGIKSLKENDNLVTFPTASPMANANLRNNDSSVAIQKVPGKLEPMPAGRGQPPTAKPQTSFNQMTLQQANQHLEYGKALARRGAAGSAKQEFLAALALLAQSNDAQSGSNVHSESLRRGLNALDESRDFMLTEPEKQIGRSVREVIRGHRTDLFNDQTAEHTTSIDALRQYLFHAKQQLEFATGNSPIAGHTFFCLGKLQTAQPTNHPSFDIISRTQGIIYHSTALSCDSANYQSAHELGVLLARSGEWGKSRQMLERSLRIQQTPEAWKNLAMVNQNLNQLELAQKANAEYQRMLADQSGRTIHWMNPMEFAKTNPVEFGETEVLNPQPQPEKSAPPDRMGKVESTEKQSLGNRIKGIF